MDKYMLCFKLVDVRFFCFIYDLGFSDYVVYIHLDVCIISKVPHCVKIASD